jgi:hypothetical protein
MSGKALVAVAAALVLAAPAAGQPKKDAGSPVLLAKRTKTSGCLLGVDPDRRCSPGAYASKLTQKVVCSKGFRTGDYRDVSVATKHAVEAAYGMKPKSYGRSLEIDHIISLELGGSNAVANLFPEKRSPPPGYRVKDQLENKLHDLVCEAHTMTLRQAQRAIARNWRATYAKVFGIDPS